ncbi:hypothetical protein MMC18_006855 [Xylographa bjoerkii]|nr:hypothetical protein [Xylographa bjoerkii]
MAAPAEAQNPAQMADPVDLPKAVSRETEPTREGVLQTLALRDDLGAVLTMQGKYEEAEQILRQTLETRENVLFQGREDPDVIGTLHNLAGALNPHNRFAEAEAINREILASSQKVMGKEHPDTLTIMNNLAEVLAGQGKYDEAEGLHRQTLKTVETVEGKEHPNTLGEMNNLANVLAKQGKFDEAEKMHEHVLASRKKILREQHPAIESSMHNLASVYRRQGKDREAEALYRQSLDLTETRAQKLPMLGNLAGVPKKQPEHDESEGMYSKTPELARTVWGPQHPDTLSSMKDFVHVLIDQGEYEKAEVLQREMLGMAEAQRVEPASSVV